MSVPIIYISKDLLRTGGVYVHTPSFSKGLLVIQSLH